MIKIIEQNQDKQERYRLINLNEKAQKIFCKI